MDVDLLVVGGGPAGAAAALTARRLGMTVLVLESAGGARFRPGETLAPGTVALLAGLVGADCMRTLPGAAHDGIVVHAPDGRRLHRYGGATTGRHLFRAELDAALLATAERQGAHVARACPASAVTIDADGVTVIGRGMQARGRMVLDCSGGARWLSRQLAIPMLPLSRPLAVGYGYSATLHQDAPCFHIDAEGWHWAADLGRGERVDCRMRFDGTRSAGPRHADATWTIAAELAGPAFLLAGDAACRVDPAASHGVLRALVSGIQAAESAAAHLRQPSGAALLHYCRRQVRWFLADCDRLDRHYRHLAHLADPVGFQARRLPLFGSSL